ncbi:MAG: ATP-binding protein, partial [Campylobacterota bacterium]|nr:ATP-binding protein [Campylobacterota bacterium]
MQSIRGFRLSHFEFYNWGTYNKSIVKLELESKNGLLTGDIGSGKSTIVDALTTLLVPHQKIVYNKAAGAESKERSLLSYILGEYKSSKEENYTQAKAVTLRESKNTFSVLLANFKSKEFKEEVTIAQFFYISNNQVHKFFIVSKSLLTIADDLFDFKDIRELKKNLRTSTKNSVYESFSEYSKSFRRLMGIKNEQALNLFHQTVSLKAIGNLTQFIRTQMLEPSSMDIKIDELVQNFSELNHIHTLVLRAKRKIELLLPIDKEGKKYEKNFQQKIAYEEYREVLSAYFSTFKVSLLEKKLSELEIEIIKRESQKKSADTEQDELQNQMIELQIELKQNGGDRVHSIENEIGRFQKIEKTKRESNHNYNRLVKELELPVVSSEHRFLNNLKEVKEQFSNIELNQDTLLNKKMIENVAHTQIQESVVSLEKEMLYLKNNRSNIPQRVSKIRDDMVQKLSLTREDLPFIGELIEIEDKRWEGAIERVLHSFALSLVVDKKYYEKVSEYVNSTNLKGKLVYLKIDTQNIKESYIERESNSLLNKIAIKASSIFFNAVKS